jgi:Spy/CpxP family protein refolding chaperone
MWRRMGMMAMILALAAPAPAQPLRERIREKLKVLRMARVVEALELDERTSARLMPIINKAYDDIGAVAKDAGQARRELRRLIESGSNDPQPINALIDRLVANKMRVDQLETEMFRDVRKVLTPQQLARLVLILPEINRELQQQIRRAARGEAPDEP